MSKNTTTVPLGFDHDALAASPAVDLRQFDRLSVNPRGGIEDTMVMAVPLDFEPMRNESGGNHKGVLHKSVVHLKEWEVPRHDHIAARVPVVRDGFRSLTGEQVDLINPYINRLANEYVFSAPHALKPYLAQGRSVTEWLAYGADNEHVADFIEAHDADLVEQSQSEAVARIIATEKNLLVQSIRPLVNSGKISPHALTKIPMLQRTNVRLGDVWDTLLLGRGGYQNQGSNEIVIPQGIGGTWADTESDQMYFAENSVVHEGWHVPFGHFMPELFQEMITHHLTVSVKSGGFSIISPKERQRLQGDTNSQYVSIRNLMSVISTEGHEAFPAEVWTKAFTSHDENSRESIDFYRKVYRAWGVRSDEIADYCGKAQEVIAGRPDMKRASQIAIQAEAAVWTAAWLRDL